MKPVHLTANPILTLTQTLTARRNLQKERENQTRERIRRKRKKRRGKVSFKASDNESSVSKCHGFDSCFWSFKAPDVKEQTEEQKEREKEKEKEKKPKDDQPPRPRPLHRTCSLFMRSIAPSISKAEIVAVSVHAKQCFCCYCP